MDLIQDSSDLDRVALIEAQRSRGAASGMDLCGQLLEGIQVAPSNRNPGAGVGQRPAYPNANAIACSGD